MTKSIVKVLIASNDSDLVMRFTKILGQSNTVTCASTWSDVTERTGWMCAFKPVG
jgi:hypothetical protein